MLTIGLTPLAWVYGAVMAVRNRLYDKRILKSVRFDVPVIGVGNLTIGGTGKTPHVEYLAERLSGSYNVAVLSRGYRRKTRGFVLANRKSTPEMIGDEPYQIYQKFNGRVHVAVSESRVKGMQQLLKMHPEINLVILDDSFQHRSIDPLISILLMDSTRPFYDDNLLPLGRLRESRHGVNRADFVIVTKCPDDMNPIDYRIFSKNLALFPYQKLFFSGYHYGRLEPVFPDSAPYSASLVTMTSNDSVLLLTGVANPRPLVKYLRKFQANIKVASYPDHHFFSRRDLERIEQRYHAMKGERKLILTTEKDAVRLASNPYFPEELKPYIFYQPINVEMRQGVDPANLIDEIRAVIADPS